MMDFATMWQAARKVVYSTTLSTVTTAGTKLERNFDPGAVRAMKASASRDFMIGGAALAGQAFDAGLVDECHYFVAPALLGKGKPAYSGDAFVPLTLLEERRFESGALYLRYRVER